MTQRILSLCGALALAGGLQPATLLAADANAVSVRALTPQSGVAERKTTQPATVHPFFEASIHARATGYLKELRADIGDAVNGGDVLAVIDAPDLEAAVGRARAEVAAAESKLQQARASVSAAAAQAQVAESDFKRVEAMAEKGTLNEAIVDESRAKRESARAAAQVAEAEVAASEAGVAVARSGLQETEALASFLEIKAPFNGVVTARNIDPGDLVKSDVADKPLFVVTQLDKVRVRIPVPERDAPAVRVGDKVEFTCPGAGKVYTGKLTRRAGRLDDLTRTMLVEVDIPNDKRDLLPGMYGTATIFMGSGDQAGLLVPSSAVRPADGGAIVYAIVDGRIKSLPVKVGMDDGLQAQIIQGLRGNERVVADASARLVEGQAVTVIGAQ